MKLVKCSDCGVDMSKKARVCPKCGAPKKKKTSFTTWGVIVLVGLVVVFSQIGGGGSETVVEPSKPRELPPRDAALAAVTSEMNWRRAGFDNVLEVELTVSNGYSAGIKDFRVVCSSYGKSETRIARHEKYIYDSIAAGGSKNLGWVNMGLIDSQVDRVGCSVRDLSLL